MTKIYKGLCMNDDLFKENVSQKKEFCDYCEKETTSNGHALTQRDYDAGYFELACSECNFLRL